MMRDFSVPSLISSSSMTTRLFTKLLKSMLRGVFSIIPLAPTVNACNLAFKDPKYSASKRSPKPCAFVTVSTTLMKSLNIGKA